MGNNPLWDIEEAFEKIGCEMYPMTDDDCSKLLAWLNEFGWLNEAVISNMVLNCRIIKAQNRFNLFGGEIPNGELILLLHQRINELKKTGLKTEWLKDMYIKFKIDFPKLEL